MSDLKTNWNDPGAPTPGLDGAGVTARGGDPLFDTGGNGAIKDFWPDPVTRTPDGKETANSVSGMPTQPARFEPSGTPPAPPSLQDRNPGTIDK